LLSGCGTYDLDNCAEQTAEENREFFDDVGDL